VSYEKKFFVVDLAAKKFSERLLANTGGKVEIKVFGGGQFGSPPEHWAQIKSGAIDMFCFDLGGISMIENNPKNFNVTKAAFVFEGQEGWLKYLKSDLFKQMMAKPEKNHGIKYVAYLGRSGVQGISTSNKRVVVPEDLKGQKIRVPGEPIFVEIYKAWGATPTPINPKDIYTSLKTGLVDGLNMYFEQMYTMKWYEIQKYYTWLDWNHSGVACWMNGKKWESLPDDVKKAFPKSAEEASQYIWNYITSMTGEGVEVLSKAGVEIIHPDLTPWKKIAQEVAMKDDGKMWEKGLYDKVRATQQ
jgi:TRAP-type C4-dicarboxylate transport system substrate-binding protein